jgi:hypothetical protein
MVCGSEDHGFFKEPAMNPHSETHPPGRLEPAARAPDMGDN